MPAQLAADYELGLQAASQGQHVQALTGHTGSSSHGCCYLPLPIPESLPEEIKQCILREWELQLPKILERHGVYKANVLPGSRIGCIVGYLQLAELSDQEKVKVLLALSETMQMVAQKHELVYSDSPRLQIGKCMYSLSASGSLQTRHCEVLPKVLSAHLIPGNPIASSSSSCFTDGGTPCASLQLVVQVADVLAEDKLRLHCDGDSSMLYLDVSTAELTKAKQGIQLTVAVPSGAKPVAVELMRGLFASQKTDIRPVRYRSNFVCTTRAVVCKASMF